MIEHNQTTQKLVWSNLFRDQYGNMWVKNPKGDYTLVYKRNNNSTTGS
jgi:hypothetical protein